MSCVERDVEDLHQDLGSGAYGFVKKMRHKETGLVMAVKVRASFGQLLRDTVRSDQIGSDSLLARLWLHRLLRLSDVLSPLAAVAVSFAPAINSYATPQ